TTRVARGRHTITESVTLTSGSVKTVTATFSVGTPAHSVALAWNASPTLGVTYDLYRGTSQGGPYSMIQNALATTTAADSAVTSGATYFYVVRAHDSGGESASSNEIKAVIP